MIERIEERPNRHRCLVKINNRKYDLPIGLVRYLESVFQSASSNCSTAGTCAVGAGSKNSGWFVSSEIKPNDGEIIDIWINTGEVGGRIPDCIYDVRGFCTIKDGFISKYPDQECVTRWRRKPLRPEG